MSLTCATCLELIEAAPVVSTCCITWVCPACAADWFKSPANQLTCQLCGGNMAMAGDSINHPVIQECLTQQGHQLVVTLQHFQAKLTVALTQWQKRQASWLTNMEQLAGQIPDLIADQLPELAGHLTRQLNTFGQAIAKELAIILDDLTSKVNSTAVRLDHLQAYLTPPLALTVMVLAHDWTHELNSAQELCKIDSHRNYVWYRHPQAIIATELNSDSQHYSLKPQIILGGGSYCDNGLPLNRVRIASQGDRHWSVKDYFLDWRGHVKLYRRHDEDVFRVEIVDVTAAADDQISPTAVWITLQSRFSSSDIFQIQMVAAVQSGYLVCATHSRRDPVTINGRELRLLKIVLIYFDQSGRQAWSKSVSIGRLDHIQVYQDRLYLFASRIHIYSFQAATDHKLRLVYQGDRILVKSGAYRYYWSRDNWLYFLLIGGGPDRFYRFNMAESLDNKSPVVLIEVSAEVMLGGARPDLTTLSDYRPVMLPGQTVYCQTHYSSSRGIYYELRDQAAKSLIMGQLVALPDYYGRIYAVAE